MKTTRTTKCLFAGALALSLGIAALPAALAAPPSVGGIVGYLVKQRMLEAAAPAKLRVLIDRVRTCRRDARQRGQPYAGCLGHQVAVESERVALLYKSEGKVAGNKQLERRVSRALHRHGNLLDRLTKRAAAHAKSAEAKR